jgi:hypothetical protein
VTFLRSVTLYSDPGCGLALRSRNLSLLPSVFVFVIGLPSLPGDGYLPKDKTDAAEILGIDCTNIRNPLALKPDTKFSS